MEANKQFWLLKTEPGTFSFEDLKARQDRTEAWDGVRNYQARNYIRDRMKPGDAALFYHSSSGGQTGVVGLAEVVSMPDPTAFDP